MTGTKTGFREPNNLPSIIRFYNNVFKTTDIDRCSDLFTTMKKIFEEKAKMSHEVSANERVTIEEQPPTPIQFTPPHSKSDERLVS